TTQTPRRPIGAGGVRGASRSGSASVITTHALFARKVQRKLSNGVAGFAAGGSSSDRKRARPIRAFSATPHDGQRPCRRLAEDPGRTQPRAAYPRRCSSNASGLHGRNSARILGILATFQRDNLRRHFGVRVLSRQPGSPVSSVICGLPSAPRNGILALDIARSVDFPPLAEERVQRTAPPMRRN